MWQAETSLTRTQTKPGWRRLLLFPNKAKDCNPKKDPLLKVKITNSGKEKKCKMPWGCIGPKYSYLLGTLANSENDKCVSQATSKLLGKIQGAGDYLLHKCVPLIRLHFPTLYGPAGKDALLSETLLLLKGQLGF